MRRRVAIVFDGKSWFVRRIRTIAHDLDRDEKVYRCDRHLGGPFKTAQIALQSIKPKKRWVTCWRCGGTGSYYEDVALPTELSPGPFKCPSCGGRGRRVRRKKHA